MSFKFLPESEYNENKNYTPIILKEKRSIATYYVLTEEARLVVENHNTKNALSYALRKLTSDERSNEPGMLVIRIEDNDKLEEITRKIILESEDNESLKKSLDRFS